jgi:hypothetical protein
MKREIIGFWDSNKLRHITAPVPRDKAAEMLRYARSAGAPTFRTPAGFKIMYRAQPRDMDSIPSFALTYKHE